MYSMKISVRGEYDFLWGETYYICVFEFLKKKIFFGGLLEVRLKRFTYRESEDI